MKKRIAIGLALVSVFAASANRWDYVIYGDNEFNEIDDNYYRDLGRTYDNDETTIITPYNEGRSGTGYNVNSDRMFHYDLQPDGSMYIFEL